MRYFIGVDLHRKFSQVCVLDEEGTQMAQQRLYHEDEQPMVDFFGAFETGTAVAVEATRGWMWISDLLEGLGLEVHLAHCLGVRLIAESRLKTDKVDAWALAQLLRTGFLPESYLAPTRVRDQRMLLRHRQAMVRTRTSIKNRVHGLLARYNIHIGASDIFGRAGMGMLRALELPSHARRILDDQLEYIEYANKQIKSLEDYLRKTIAPDPRVGWLRSLPGVGKITAYYLIAEIGEIERFRSAGKLVSYCGLCPTNRGSAGKMRHGRPRGGRRLLRWALIEAAHTAVRRDSYFGSVFGALQRRKGKQIAYVAAARKMAQIIWHMLVEQRAYRPRKKYSQVGSTGPMAAQ
jgi:transposase